MFRAYSILVRTSYLLAIVQTLLSGCWLLIELGASRSSRVRIESEVLVFTVTTLVFVVPSARALLRLVFHRELVPHLNLVQRPVIAALVLISSTLGTALIALVAWTLLSTLPESPDGNLAGPMVLAIMLYAFALLTGEIVLVGRTARIAR
jgi:hypothetical protein